MPRKYTYAEVFAMYQHAWSEGFSDARRPGRPRDPGKLVDLGEWLAQRAGRPCVEDITVRCTNRNVCGLMTVGQQEGLSP